MSSHSPSPGVLETVVSDKDIEIAPPIHAPEPKMSKSLRTTYNRAKKAGKVQDGRAQRICAELRARREGTPAPFDDVAQVAPKKAAQTSFNDF